VVSQKYEAQLVHVYLNGNRMQCPNKEKSPEYYSEQQYNMWFEFSSIAECDEREVELFLFREDHGLFSKIQLCSLFLKTNKFRAWGIKVSR
jgi:hypothetical protein